MMEECWSKQDFSLDILERNDQHKCVKQPGVLAVVSPTDRTSHATLFPNRERTRNPGVKRTVCSLLSPP